MPLSKDALRASFLSVFNDVQNRVIQVPTPPIVPVPLMPMPIATALANAYHKWALGAIAGGMLPLGGNPSPLAAQLAALPLMSGWGTGCLTYWAAVTWLTPGVMTGVTIPVVMLKNSADIALKFFAPPSPSSRSPGSNAEFADALATILHANTTSLTVTQTVIQTGITAVVPVS